MITGLCELPRSGALPSRPKTSGQSENTLELLPTPPHFGDIHLRPFIQHVGKLVITQLSLISIHYPGTR